MIREPVEVTDITDERQTVAPQVRRLLSREGMRSLLAVPFVREEQVLGGLVILRREPGSFSAEVIGTLRTFAAQSVLAIQNARLFRELEEKGRQLELASRHKSQFLANMSHELRTPDECHHRCHRDALTGCQLMRGAPTRARHGLRMGVCAAYLQMAERRRSRSQMRELQRDEISLVREAEYIVDRAMAGEARVVSLPRLVFFSTATGDAWLLDVEDRLALRLAAEGNRLPFAITETPERFAIEWSATFRIEGDAMVLDDNRGGSRRIFGYPTTEIAGALERARA